MQCWESDFDSSSDDVSDADTAPIVWAEDSDDDSFDSSEPPSYVEGIVRAIVEGALVGLEPALPPENTLPEAFLDFVEARVEERGAFLAESKPEMVGRVRAYASSGSWGKPLAARFGALLKRLNALDRYAKATDFRAYGALDAPARVQVDLRPFRKRLGLRVRKVAVGDNHALFLGEDARVYGLGSNAHGQLGTNEFRQVYTWREMHLDQHGPAVDVACGYSTSFVTTETSGTFACGSNANGRLGIGGLEYEEARVGQWTKMMVGFPLEQVCAGSTHGAAVGAVDKRLYTWGKGLYSGRGGVDPNYGGYPQRVDALGCVLHVSIFYAGYHTVAVDALGQAWGFGHNRVGQLGNRDGVIATRPLRYALPPLSVVRVLTGWGNTAFVLRGNPHVLKVLGRNCRGQCGLKGGHVNSLRTPFCSDFVDVEFEGNPFFSTTALHAGNHVYGKVAGAFPGEGATVVCASDSIVVSLTE